MIRSGLFNTVILPVQRRAFRGSRGYWETRYAGGGNSGAGSYGATANFKAKVINQFVADRDVQSVVEFGCGDGHQLTLARYPEYLGLDVSSTAVRMCRDRFADDRTKSFLAYDPNAFVNNGALSADLALSLDVILHLVEDDVYEKYMADLFGAATRLVGIFSMDEEHVRGLASHVRWRKFTDWVTAHAPDWRLIATVENPEKGNDTAADFYLFERTLEG